MQPDLRPLVFATLAIFVSLVTDLRTGKILNVVTLPALLLTLVLKTFLFGLGPAFGHGLVSSVLGALAYPTLLVFVMRLVAPGSLGMGAVKLMAVLGAGVGFLPSLVCAAVTLATVVAFAVIAWSKGPEKRRKLPGSVLVFAAWLLGVPIAAWLRW
ncbi:MAG: prepilin peptidase [Myxococcales bacterium]